MFKSRTVPISIRFYGAFALVALVGAAVVGVTSHHEQIIAQVIGPLDLGWKGGVGNHLAYTVLVGLAVVAAVVGGVLTAFRDTDATAEAEVAGLEVVPLTRAPRGANYWPLLSAFGLATVLMGLAISSRPTALAGGFVVGASAVMWTVRAWAERATGSDRANLEAYHQVVEPLRLPITALLVVGLMILGISRLLLALPSKHASTAIFAIVGIVILGACIGVALRPKLGRTATTIILLVLGVAVLVAGIVGAARGPREFEQHNPTAGTQVPEGSGR
jgi:hypothetical protein